MSVSYIKERERERELIKTQARVIHKRKKNNNSNYIKYSGAGCFDFDRRLLCLRCAFARFSRRAYFPFCFSSNNNYNALFRV